MADADNPQKPTYIQINSGERRRRFAAESHEVAMGLGLVLPDAAGLRGMPQAGPRSGKD
jgi:hypothetical protein